MNELGDGTEKWNRKMAKCAGTPNSYTTFLPGYLVLPSSLHCF